ncbi:MAG: hypothetical protein HY906_03290 [Deltaproteobacteria bacterium]|nr:hypothetical protein [Deltaproteobacteria bacterium]
MRCKVEGCNAQVPGRRPLCLEHWKAKRDGELEECSSCGGPLVGAGEMCRGCDARYISEREREAADNSAHVRGERLSATKIGEGLGLKAYGVNRVLAELGWVESDGSGWVATPLGIRQGALVREHQQSGSSFVLWPSSIVDNRFFRQTVKRLTSGPDGPALLKNLRPVSPMDDRPSTTILPRDSNLRPGWTPGDYMALDGHFVRSLPEKAIDDWLYTHRVLHAYERELPVAGELRSDFFLPEVNLHIEFWGRSDEAYLARKRRKQQVYHRERIPVIDLEPKHLKGLDAHLRKQLSAHGVVVGKALVTVDGPGPHRG